LLFFLFENNHIGGAGSGKSTIIKLMDIIHNNGYSRDDFEQYRKVVYSNTIQSLAKIIQAMKKLHIEYDSSDREQDAAMSKSSFTFFVLFGK